jgi:LPXTG-motif cell wall-anchored protein
MKQFFVSGVALLALVASSCATRGYVRRQAAKVNERAGQVQAQATALSEKHATDVAHFNERVAAADSKFQEAVTSAQAANANAAQANANAARADASAAQAYASTARAEAITAQADASAARAEAVTARAEAAAAQERAVMAENTAPKRGDQGAERSQLPTKLPKTGSPLPLIMLSGLFSLGASGALRLIRR